MPIAVRLGVLVCLACFLGAWSPPQSVPDRVTEREARQWASEAELIAKHDVKTFDKEFSKRASARIQDYEPKGQSVDIGFRLENSLSIKIYGQVAAFQVAAAEQVRQLRPLAEAKWQDGVVVTVNPLLMVSPLIERVVIKRGDSFVEAIENHIQDSKVRNLAGAVFDSREGYAVFELGAFQPQKDLKIRLVLIPVTGKNLEADPQYWLAGVQELPKRK